MTPPQQGPAAATVGSPVPLGPSDPPPSAHEAIAAAREVLSGTVYRRGMAIEDPGALEDLGSGVRRWILGLVDALVDLREAEPLAYWALVLGLVGVLGLLLWHIQYSVRRASAAGRPRTDADEEATAPAPRDLARDQAEAEAEGRWAEAARLLLLRAVADALGRDAVAGRRHLTVRELVDLAGHDGAPRALADLGLAVERALYRGDGVDADTYSDLRRRVARGAEA